MSRRGGRPQQDCRLVLRDVARLLLYPLFLLNWVVVGFGCCLCAVRVRGEQREGGLLACFAYFISSLACHPQPH